MKNDKKKNLLTFAVIILFIFSVVIVTLTILGPIIGDVFSTINNSLGSPYVGTPSPTSIPGTLVSEMEEIDRAMKESLRGSLAYNTPDKMQLGETVAVELLISPAVPADELGEQIEESGEVVVSTIEVTPRMKVELKTADKDAFLIEPLHDSPEQLLNTMEPTKWTWWVTAEKGGIQTLTVVAYRMIKYDGQEYWREVESYRADIEVEITLGQRLLNLDWKWLLGIILSAILIPAFWRWIDKRKDEK